MFYDNCYITIFFTNQICEGKDWNTLPFSEGGPAAVGFNTVFHEVESHEDATAAVAKVVVLLFLCFSRLKCTTSRNVGARPSFSQN